MSISEHIRTDDLMVIAALEQALGEDRVKADHETRLFYANDIFWQPGIAPLAVVMPSNAEELSAAVCLATEAGVAVVPRGGGMSYTKGYLPERSDSIVIDARNMNRIVEVNTTDMYITVEAGVTWEEVNEALEGTNLRTGYWGPLSGIRATVGGALSQNSAFFGSALNGTVAESVLGITLVLADGRIVTTGSGGRKGTKPFTRFGGPDLTGMFLGDNGAMGIKAGATLRLWPKPAEVDYLTFGFESLKDMALAQTAMARTRMVSEGFGIDRTKAQHSASVNRLSDSLKTLGNVASAGKSLLAGVKNAVDVATSGTSFLMKHPYTLHIVTEARNAPELAVNVSTLRAIGERTGKSLPNSVPKVMRSKPFSPVRGMLGLNGERWVPIHAVFPLGDAERVVQANDAYFAERAADMAEHGIVYTIMTMTVGNEFFIEPAFYWMDEITSLHEQSLGAEVVKPWRDRAANPQARDAVARLRRGTQELYASLGGVSWQVARDYPFREILNDSTWSLLCDVKKAVDPRGLMNPGSLGLKG
ncbi:FAD-binding oxidoreductase [Mesorhizobium microcysteis]|uniref:FAD-binding oxidoreductase n=1 Tax=Neoaquamicrobium microcysteis TaxID=2682781 RepID=A0A5D4GNW7_9HYPH|nr:FAD-binding oxidoreductase [Mesorhizobium microcysteis]TYR30526.1 FAD-binding oxidoreductase [Mesorhizobium microcysteis]